MKARKTIIAVMLGITTALTVTACQGDDVQTKPETDVTALVRQHADAIAAVVGSPLTNPATNASGCKGKLGETSDTIYSVQGVFNLAVPADTRRRDTIAKVRADWQTKGYTITNDRETGTDGGVLTAKTADGFSVDVESTTGTGLAVIIHSPCFQRP